MGLQIEDGTGGGSSAKVDVDGRLSVVATTTTAEHHANHHDGRAYNLLFSATPTGADDCFLYFKNSDDTDIVLEGFWVKLAADEYIDIKIGDTGTPIGGSDITPVNLNTGSGIPADGVFQNGVNITGLSGGNTAFRIYNASSAGSTNHNFDQDIVVKKNGVITFYAQTGGTPIEGFIVFNYHAAL